MKKTLIASIATITFGSVFAQSNTLPASGNVGIGTTSPTEKLSVRGNALIDSTLTVNDSLIVKKDLHVRERLIVEQDVFLQNNLSVRNQLRIGNKATFENKIKMTGLDEAVSLDNTFMLFAKENGLVEKAGLEMVLGQLYSSPCKTLTNGDVPNPTWKNGLNKIFTPCPEIRVGIGTDAPTHQLHTIGDVLFANKLQVDGNVAIGTQPSNFSKFKIRNNGRSAGLEIDQSGNNQSFAKLLFLQYSNPGTEIIKVTNTVTNQVPFLLQADGRMVIHNGTQKIFQLNPDGILQARVVILDATNWPDYVFTPDYNLMPLSEVKAYIQTNGHLPEVPSAQETSAQGINIAEMNKILLQKIEELTLHMIQQEERIKELEAKKQ